MTTKTFLDAASPWQIGFQDPATPVMEGIINYHHNLLFILILTTVFVCWMLYRVIDIFDEKKYSESVDIVHGSTIEIIWTTIPALVLLSVAIPSFALLYSIDEVVDPMLTLKVIGSQWYWTYEYSDTAPDRLKVATPLFGEASPNDRVPLIFDSYMVQEDDLGLGSFRLLEVDQRVIVPVNTHIRVLITATDVLHSWAVPALGVKLDACPGRLNQTSLFVKRVGVFYGQCSEICGINHGFMPIVVEAVKLEDYNHWLDIKTKAGLPKKIPAVVPESKDSGYELLLNPIRIILPPEIPEAALPYYTDQELFEYKMKKYEILLSQIHCESNQVGFVTRLPGNTHLLN